jgi:hypothetical protein
LAVWLTVVLSAIGIGWPSRASAQDPEPATRAEELAAQQAAKARTAEPYTPGSLERRLIKFDATGGFGIARPIGVAFGDIKAGSGFAIGPTTGWTFTNGSFYSAKAEYSIHNYKLGQVFYQAAPIADGRLILNGRVRWQDAPKVRFYDIGAASPRQHAHYGEERTEASAQVLAHPFAYGHFAGGTGYEKYRTDGGAVDPDEDHPLPVVPSVPGLDADPGYLHSFFSAALSTREFPAFDRGGTLVQGVFHDYHDRGGPYSFRQVNGIAQQLVPILYGNIILDLSARVWTTSTTAGNTAPFFLMPTLGGSDFLRGFPNYRFRDRNALLLTAQYKWYLQEYLYAVVFYEAGKVASRTADLNLKGLEQSYGFGVHVHTSTATVLRLEVTGSREGPRFIFGFSPKVL